MQKTPTHNELGQLRVVLEARERRTRQHYESVQGEYEKLCVTRDDIQRCVDEYQAELDALSAGRSTSNLTAQELLDEAEQRRACDQCLQMEKIYLGTAKNDVETFQPTLSKAQSRWKKQCLKLDALSDLEARAGTELDRLQATSLEQQVEDLVQHGYGQVSHG